MAKTKIVLNKSGVRAILQSDEMKAICEEHANRALGRLGPGYTVSSMAGATRVNASIYAESTEAKRDNSENNTILKALRG